MSIHVYIILFLIISSKIIHQLVDVQAHMMVKKFENCNPNANYKAKFNITITTENGKQYADGLINFMAPVDNTIRSNVTVEMLTGNKYTYLFPIIENKGCDLLHKLLGEFIYDLERQMQLIPGMCPIPAGRYHLHNVLLNVEKLPILAALPIGTLRFTDLAYDKNNNCFTCFKIEVQNRI